MKQQFMRGGKWMTLEKAKEYDASRQAEKAPKKLVTLAEQGKAPVVKPEAKITHDHVGEDFPDGGVENVKTPTAEPTLEELKAKCDEKGIKYHHASGIKKLQELLNNHVIN